jgi:hypothetical protein
MYSAVCFRRLKVRPDKQAGEALEHLVCRAKEIVMHSSGKQRNHVYVSFIVVFFCFVGKKVETEIN